MAMLGPYKAIMSNGNRQIRYVGNNVFESIENVTSSVFTEEIGQKRLAQIVNDERFRYIQIIDNLVFNSAVKYFENLNAEWCNLPLTTLMISSPGEMYRGKKLNYTTDSLPVQIDWFDLDRKIFLSESSQFYLELRLLQEKTEKVFSIYNSFRKDKADFSHLSEFQHVEFEGKITYEENIQIALGLLDFITNYIFEHGKESLNFFLTEKEIEVLPRIFKIDNVARISFKDALQALYKDTGDEAYKNFSLEQFGSWEEIRLTELLGKHVIVEHFPLMEIPFYHNEFIKDENGVSLSESADIILSGYRESIGTGVRIKDFEALKEKARIFNLPVEDYSSYLEMRKLPCYQKTAGFGLGWQRYVHWLLKLPHIWDATLIPRGHVLPKP